jgi:hypothetical protein
MMDKGCYHTTVPKEMSLEDVAAVFKTQGYQALFQEMRSRLESSLTPFGLPIPAIGPTRIELMISKDTAVMARMNEKRKLDLIVVSSDGKASEKSISQFGLGKLSSHSWREMKPIEEFAENLREPSSNGKLLQVRANREKLRLLYNDAIRDQLRSILDSIGENAAPYDILQQLEPFKKDGTALNALIATPGVLTKAFQIYCDRCSAPSLVFVDKNKADTTLADAGRTCPNCRTQGLFVRETYAVAEPYISGLRRGLWLESMAGEILETHTDAVWIGYYVDTNEIDVVSIFLGQKILIECKDTSFGQNDLYIAAVKGEQLEADVVIVITTKDIHPNVRAAAEKTGKKIRLLSSSSAASLQHDILSVLSALWNPYIESWFEERYFVARSARRA